MIQFTSLSKFWAKFSFITPSKVVFFNVVVIVFGDNIPRLTMFCLLGKDSNLM